MMFFPERPETLDMIRTPGVMITAVGRERRLWKPWTASRLVEIPLAKCGHEDCPPLDVIEYARGWTVKGAQKAALKIFENEERTRHQRAASEALGG